MSEPGPKQIALFFKQIEDDGGPDFSSEALAALETARSTGYQPTATAMIAVENLVRLKKDATDKRYDMLLGIRAQGQIDAYNLAVEWIMAADRMAWVDEGLKHGMTTTFECADIRIFHVAVAALSSQSEWNLCELEPLLKRLTFLLEALIKNNSHLVCRLEADSK